MNIISILYVLLMIFNIPVNLNVLFFIKRFHKYTFVDQNFASYCSCFET